MTPELREAVLSMLVGVAFATKIQGCFLHVSLPHTSAQTAEDLCYSMSRLPQTLVAAKPRHQLLT